MNRKHDDVTLLNEIITATVIYAGNRSLQYRKHIWYKTSLRKVDTGCCGWTSGKHPPPPPSSSRGVAPRDCRRFEHKSVTTDALRSFKQRWDDVADTTAPKQATLKKLFCTIQFICSSDNDCSLKCTAGIKCVINVLFCVSGNPGLSYAQKWKQLTRMHWCCSP